MIVLNESLFSKEEIEFIKCVYGGDKYIDKIDLELKIIKADKLRGGINYENDK